MAAQGVRVGPAGGRYVWVRYDGASSCRVRNTKKGTSSRLATAECVSDGFGAWPVAERSLPEMGSLFN